MSTSTHICILVPIHNRLEITKRGVNSIYASLERLAGRPDPGLEVDLVVIDDGSTDGSSEWLTANHPTCRVLKGDGNLWWSGAINKGIAYALEAGTFTHIVWWNDDTICDPDYFERLAVHLKDPAYTDCILVSKVLWEGQKNVLFSFGCLYDPRSGKSTVVGLNQQDGPAFAHPLKIGWSGGMGTTIPVAVVCAIGPLDAKHFPHYHGDKDYFLRASRAGFPAFAMPDLRIYNKEGSTGATLTPPYTKSFIRCLFSQRSQYNLSENLRFLRIHSPTIPAYYAFVRYYLIFSFAYVKKVLRLPVLKHFVLSLRRSY